MFASEHLLKLIANNRIHQREFIGKVGIKGAPIDGSALGNVLNADVGKAFFLQKFKECLLQKLAGPLNAGINTLGNCCHDRPSSSSVQIPKTDRRLTTFPTFCRFCSLTDKMFILLIDCINITQYHYRRQSLVKQRLSDTKQMIETERDAHGNQSRDPKRSWQRLAVRPVPHA